jgi:hypothetical protein
LCCSDAETAAVEMDQRDRKRGLKHVKRMAKFMLDKAGFSPADRRQYIRKHGYTGMARQISDSSQQNAAGKEIAGKKEPERATGDAGRLNPVAHDGKASDAASTVPDFAEQLAALVEDPAQLAEMNPTARIGPGPRMDEEDDATASATPGESGERAPHGWDEDAPSEDEQQQEVA